MERMQGKTPEELEQTAEDFRKDHGKFDGRSLIIELTIESFGYELFPVQGLAEIAEAYVPIVGNRIFVDEDQYNAAWSLRWRFTLAEELAHIILHRPLFEEMSVEEAQALRDSFTDEEYLRIERDAKYLAGCLLMPRNQFEERFSRFWSIQETRTSNELTILRFVVRQLSRDYNVSCHAVALRSLKLELIDQQQFDNLLESYSPSAD